MLRLNLLSVIGLLTMKYGYIHMLPGVGRGATQLPDLVKRGGVQVRWSEST